MATMVGGGGMKTVNLMTWVAIALISWVGSAVAQTPSAGAEPPDWTTPIAPFHIAGNLYYVGSKDLASYLIVTPKGNILINSSTSIRCR